MRPEKKKSRPASARLTDAWGSSATVPPNRALGGRIAGAKRGCMRSRKWLQAHWWYVVVLAVSAASALAQPQGTAAQSKAPGDLAGIWAAAERFLRAPAAPAATHAPVRAGAWDLEASPFACVRGGSAVKCSRARLPALGGREARPSILDTGVRRMQRALV